jgi:hypothetical protein
MLQHSEFSPSEAIRLTELRRPVELGRRYRAQSFRLGYRRKGTRSGCGEHQAGRPRQVSAGILVAFIRSSSFQAGSFSLRSTRCR